MKKAVFDDWEQLYRNITRIAIGPNFVGKGYGKQILNALCEEARKQGTKEFHYSYRERNLASKRLQDACGFKFDYKSEEKIDPRTGESI